MPEAQELEHEVDRLRELIEEEHEDERASRGLLRRISLSTALIAVIAAIASLEAGSTAIEALIEKSDALSLSTEAFDLWGEYQPKGIKSALLDARKEVLIALKTPLPTQLEEDRHRYGREQEGIRQEAEHKEATAKAQVHTSEQLIHRITATPGRHWVRGGPDRGPLVAW